MKIDTPWRIIDYVDAPVLALDQSGTIQHANSSAKELLGIESEGELRGCSFDSYLVGDQAAAFPDFLDEMDENGFAVDVLLSTQSKVMIPVTLTGKYLPAQVGSAECVLLTLNTRQKESESAEHGGNTPEDLAWLADQGRLLLTLDDWDEIIYLAGETLQEKLGECIVISLTKLNEDSLQLAGIFGIQNRMLEQAWKMIGGDYFRREFPIDDRFRETYATRSLYKHQGGLEEFAISQVPELVSRKLAQMVGVESIYTIGLQGIQQVLGCFYIFTLRPDRIIPANLVESYVFQVALALEKSKIAADLKNSESKFEAIFEYAPDGYYLCDKEGFFKAGNQAAERITGYDRSELIGKSMLTAGLISKDQLIKAGKLLALNIMGRSTGPDEFTLTQKAGTQIQVEISTHPITINDKPVILGIARDISSRKRNEEDLGKAHDTLTRVLEGIDAHVYVADLNNYEILYMNKRMIEDFGGDFTGKLCYEVFLDGNSKCPHCRIDELLDAKDVPGEVIVWESQNPKTGRWYKNYDRVIYWEDQRLVKLQIAVDITDTIESSQALEVSEKRYRNLFENSHNALMTIAPPNWDFVTSNAAMLELFQIDSENNLVTLKPWELSPEFQPDGRPSKETAREMIQTAIENGSHFFEWTHKKTSGEEFQATVQLSRVDLGDKFFLQATVRDISDRIRSDKIMLRQMDELALLNKLNTKAIQGRGIDEILAVFGQEVKSLFKAINAHIYLLDSDANQLKAELLSPSDSLRQAIKQFLDIVIPDSLVIDLNQSSHYRTIITNGEAVILTNPNSILGLMKEMLSALIRPQIIGKQNAGIMRRLHDSTGIESMAIVPLISESTVIGLVDLVLPYGFSGEDLGVLKSLSDLLSLIIRRVRAEEDRSAHLSEIEFISRSLVESARREDTDQICSELADNVLKANPDTYVMVSLFDPDLNAIRIRALSGLGKLADKVVKALGKKPEEFQIAVSEDNLDRELNRKYTSGKLELVPGGLYDLTRGSIPRRICQSVEKLAGVGEVYIAGFGLRGKSIGGLVLLVKEGKQIQYPSAIETIASHYAVIFERKIVQEEILNRKAQLEALRNVELEIASQLNLEVLLQTIAEEARTIVNATACGFSIYNPDRDILEYLAYTGLNALPENTDIARGEGLSGKVWDKQETLIVNDYANWEGRSKNWEEVGNYNMVGIPVIWGDEVLGVLEIAIDLKETFFPGDIKTLELFAIQAAIAVKNASLYNDQMLRRQEAETLREVGLLINRMMDRGDLLDMILSALQKVVPYNGASVQLVQGNEIVVEAYQGRLSPEQVVGTKFNIRDNPIAQEVLYEGKRVVLDTKEQIGELLLGPDIEGIQSWMAVPLEIKRNRIGIITLDHSQPHQYTKKDVSLVTDFATQAAIALENNRMFDEIRRRTREIEVVYESVMKLTRELHPDLLIEYLYQQVESMFELDAFILATYNHNNNKIQIEYATEMGLRQTQAETMEIPLEEKNSLLSWIVRKKTPLMIGNVETESLPVQPKQRGMIIRSWLGVPLLVGDRVIGALVVQSYQAQAYNHEHQRLLEMLGNQAAIALENSRLFEDAQRRLSRLSSLREIDMAISGSVDLEMTMEVLISQLINSLDVHAACVLAYNPEKDSLDYVIAQGFRTKSLQHTSLKMGEGLAGKAARERALVQIPDLREQVTSLEKSPMLGKENFVSYLAHPLVAKGDLVGVLEVFHRERLDPDPEWINFLDALARVAGIAIDRLNLFNDLSRSNYELQQAYDATIEGWARAIEMRDNSTSEHSRRVGALTINLARKLGIRGESLTHIRRGALLHDIGKMAIPDGILLKTGKLTDDEWQLMKKHPQYAYDMLSSIEYLVPALDIPYCHHERWDGTGYPQGLTGEEIPLAARIFAVVDVWDALQSDRSYRDAWPEEKAVQHLKDECGKHFDAHVVKAFLELIGKS